MSDVNKDDVTYSYYKLTEASWTASTAHGVLNMFSYSVKAVDNHSRVVVVIF